MLSVCSRRTKMCSTPRKRWSWRTQRVLNTSWRRSSCRPSTSTKPSWPCTLTRFVTVMAGCVYQNLRCHYGSQVIYGSLFCCRQADQCRKLSSNLQSQNPGHPRPVLIQVAQLCREKQHSKAIELLQVEMIHIRTNTSHFSMSVKQFLWTVGHEEKVQQLINIKSLQTC